MKGASGLTVMGPTPLIKLDKPCFSAPLKDTSLARRRTADVFLR